MKEKKGGRRNRKNYLTAGKRWKYFTSFTRMLSVLEIIAICANKAGISAVPLACPSRSRHRCFPPFSPFLLPASAPPRCTRLLVERPPPKPLAPEAHGPPSLDRSLLLSFLPFLLTFFPHPAGPSVRRCFLAASGDLRSSVNDLSSLPSVCQSSRDISEDFFNSV